MKLNGKFWVETDGEKVIGPGRVELLERIQATGSIRQAAMQMKMSYKQAWDLIHHMNTKLAKPVVLSQRGGKGGGHAELTREGEEIILEFRSLQEKFQSFLSAENPFSAL